MNYDVEYDLDAKQDVADLFRRAPDPAAVLDALLDAKRRLGRDPSQGRPLPEGLWRLEVPPVAVSYEIHAVTNTVTVTNVNLVAP
ncbi:MAG: type II toxin-antitoxin system RelE/ParE family toxin [Gemmataceae bacterium]